MAKLSGMRLIKTKKKKGKIERTYLLLLLLLLNGFWYLLNGKNLTIAWNFVISYLGIAIL
jgi:hypothetical protein